MLSRHFLVALACYGRPKSRGRGQAATLAPGASVTAPALGPVMPHLPVLGDGPTGRVWPVSPVQVSDTRSKPFNQENSINSYQQQFKTRSGTQDRNRQSDRLGKRGRRDHPSQRHLFADLPRGGPVEDHAELPFRQPAFRCQARRPGTHTHCRAQGRGGPGGWRQQSQLSAAPSGGGLNRVAFFPWTPVPARGRGALSETITA